MATNDTETSPTVKQERERQHCTHRVLQNHNEQGVQEEFSNDLLTLGVPQPSQLKTRPVPSFQALSLGLPRLRLSSPSLGLALLDIR